MEEHELGLPFSTLRFRYRPGIEKTRCNSNSKPCKTILQCPPLGSTRTACRLRVNSPPVGGNKSARQRERAGEGCSPFTLFLRSSLLCYSRMSPIPSLSRCVSEAMGHIDQVSGVVNKILLQRSHTHSLMSCLYGLQSLNY